MEAIMIPFVDLKAQYASIKGEVNAAIQGVLDSCQFTLGSEVAAFEQEFAAYSQSKHGIGVNTGTSALHLALLAAGIGPGDEVITVPFTFCASVSAIVYSGATTVFVDIDPRTFTMDAAHIEAAITPKTKAILVNSPANPTGALSSREALRDLVAIARARNILLISDEIYHAFAYDAPFASPAEFSEDVLVIDGMGKTYGVTGWRLGFAHGPTRLIEEMTKLQQFTYVCAPSVVQYAGVAMLDYDVSGIVADYKQKRDRLAAGLKGLYEFNLPGGAFYLFAKAPWGTGTEFVTEAIKNNLLIIPGGTFSKRDTHFRISYAASDTMIDRGIEILRKLARK